jgi:predicted RNA binding protein YcfA (HicA-like mRNA interferase family)
MRGSDFVRLIERVGRKRGVVVAFDKRHRKGSHGTLFYGGRKTTVKDRKKEIGPGLLGKMLNDLGLTKDDLA